MAGYSAQSLLGGGVAQPGSISNVRGMLGSAQQAGLFDPFGSPRLRAMLRQRAMQLYGAQQQNAQGMSHLWGLDPYQQRAAMAGAGIQGTGNLVGALNNAEYQGATSNIPFYQGLFNNQANFQQQQALMRQQQKMQAQGGFGQLLGGVAGALIPGAGAWFGGAHAQSPGYQAGQQMYDQYGQNGYFG